MVYKQVILVLADEEKALKEKDLNKAVMEQASGPSK